MSHYKHFTTKEREKILFFLAQEKTITPDRGKEFSRHEEISKALNDVQFYFPEPHQPWQRGTNGLLHEYFPKK